MRTRWRRFLVVVFVVLGLGWSERHHLAWAVARATQASDRVAAARARLKDALPATFAAAHVTWPPREIFLRAIKENDDGSPGVVEVWAGDGRDPLRLVKSYPICATSGVPGPKRKSGDLQIPEGFYWIDRLNPQSSYHLSMHVNYPNDSDRIRARSENKDAPLGGDIMIHGACVTIGCIPIENEPVEEVYLAVSEVLPRGPVAIHLFPRRLDASGLRALQATTPDPALRAFWAELQEGWRAFEDTHRVPRVTVDKEGSYVVSRATPR
jgi:murein L,D-transpeptidase YafK